MPYKIQSLSSSDNIPDHTRRMSQLAYAIGGFAIGTAEFVIMGLLPEVAGAMGVSTPVAGHFISAYALGVVIGAPVLAVLTAKLPRKGLLIGLMLLYAFGNIISVTAPGYASFLILRFLSGLPHGVYFGVAAVTAAAMVPLQQRPQAIGNVMLGLTVATLLGAPGGTLLGQLFGWKIAFIMVGVIALLAACMIWRYMPVMPTIKGASPLAELGALKSLQMWLMLAVIGVGSGGMFAVFSYIKPILIDVSGISLDVVPFILPLFGLGMVTGNLVGPRIALRLGIMRTIFITLMWSILVFLVFYFMVSAPVTAALATFLVGTTFASQPSIQTRIMDVSGHAPTLATALLHSFFNIANATGAYAGGEVIDTGYGLASTGWVAAAFALGGFLLFIISWRLDKKS